MNISCIDILLSRHILFWTDHFIIIIINCFLIQVYWSGSLQSVQQARRNSQEGWIERLPESPILRGKNYSWKLSQWVLFWNLDANKLPYEKESWKTTNFLWIPAHQVKYSYKSSYFIAWLLFFSLFRRL